MGDTADTLEVSDDGFGMPTVEVLTGRGFITGKSGSGKSNTTSVIAEELLEAEVPLLIVDTDNEYYGLKEEYEVLHLGGDKHCDKQVTPSHAESIAEVALKRQVPTILDVSGFRDPEEGHELVGAVVEELFVLEKTERTPFLLVIEEAHEFMPEQGGLDDTGEMLIRVAKRGRKRGLGICALSQRPASVTKDYITQCDWLVWHRLTWENDTQVVGRILGSEAAEDVQDLDTGEAIVMTDWDDMIQRVKFREKRTFDAGATPDLDSIERPEFKSVNGNLLGDLAAVDDVEDADDAAQFHRGEDPNADDDEEREETHLAEVHGGAEESGGADENGDVDEPDTTTATDDADERDDATGSADADDPEEEREDEAVTSDGTASSDETDEPDEPAESGGTIVTDDGARTDTTRDAGDPTDLEVRSSFVDESSPEPASGTAAPAPEPAASTTSTAPEPASSTASAAASGSGSGAGGRSRGLRGSRAVESPEPAGDPAWEIAQFVTFIEGRVLGGIRRAALAAYASARRGAARAADGAVRGAEWVVLWFDDQTETDLGTTYLPKLLLLVLGVLVGAVLATLLT